MAAKIKFKLDGEQIKQFFVRHTEKLVLGAFTVLALFLMYKGVLRETFKSTPQDLNSAAQNATAELSRSTLDPQQEKIEVIDYAAKADEQVKDLAVAGFEWLPIRHPVWPRGSKRGVPPLLAVEDLRVHAGRAAFELKAARGEVAAAPAPPAEEPRGRRAARRGEDEPAAPAPPPGRAKPGNIAGHRYVVIVGRVPLEKQTNAYLTTFADAAVRHAADEAPDYRGVIVERAEVVTGAPNEKLKWTTLSAATRREIQQGLAAAKRHDPISAGLVDNYLTEPLPPRQGGDFPPAEVVHPSMLDAGPAVAAPPPPPKPEPMAPDDLPPFPDEPAADKPAEPEPVAAAQAAAPNEGALLFRYFDFTVEPGKRYRYRVKLWLVNPNYGVEANQLTEEALAQREELQKTRAKDRFLLTPESDPSEAVFVPYDGVLIAGDWTPANSVKESSVSVGVEQWTADDGATAQYVKEPVYRGELVNFPVNVPEGRAPDPGAAIFELGDNIPRMNEEPIWFRTEVAVLDMAPSPADGGASSKAVPADILVLDAAGRLRVCAAAEMADQFREIRDNVAHVNDQPKPDEPAANKFDPLDPNAGRRRPR
ncbi:MAG: hypothetical protein AB7U73_19085 [Pirellulales bacterium]